VRVITIDMCLSGRELTEPRPSPDGTTVAFVARWGAMSAIVTVPITGGPERLVTTAPEPAPGRGSGGGCFDWSPAGDALVYAARDGQLWLQPMPGGVPRRLTEVEEGRSIEGPVLARDGTFVVGVVDQAEVWRWWTDGEQPPERLDDGAADFVFDPFITTCGTTLLWQAWNVPDMPWDAARVQRVTFDGEVRDEFRANGAMHQLRNMPDGSGICVRDDTGWLNVWLGDAPMVDEPFEHSGPTWGMGQRSFAVSPDGSRVAFTRNERGFGRLCVADVPSRAVSDVARGVHGQLHWVGDRLVALRSGARTPTQIVAYDVGDWSRSVLAVGPVTAWDVTDLPEPELVTVERDGTVLHARRYPAIGGAARGVLCWVHGGPTDQWQVEFMPRLAYWCGQRFDVLVPDPRGSTGHGRRYQQAMRGEWGRIDVDDVAAIVADSHAAGRSDPRRTVMMGSSAGGFTALGVLGLHPGLAAGGVVLYPVTDLVALAAESHRFEAHYTISLVGPLDDRATYRERSPMSYADRIDVPLLVMHGDADPVVPVSSTLAFVDRMRDAGGDVELHVFEGEGHGFRQPANRRADFELTGAFLTRTLA
jgi:dipeptidyl aminopeptidase/acylaminoacyl peptidase